MPLRVVVLAMSLPLVDVEFGVSSGTRFTSMAEDGFSVAYGAVGDGRDEVGTVLGGRVGFFVGDGVTGPPVGAAVLGDLLGEIVNEFSW